MHRDAHDPTDANLTRRNGDTANGALAAPNAGSDKGIGTSATPSRLAPNLANKTALADSKSKGPHGRITHVSSGGGGSGSGAGGASSCVTFYGAPHDPNATWIEFELLDGAGGPVSGEPYRVTLPDGSVREGKTDTHGLVCFTGIAHGNAEIEWTGALGKYVKYVGSTDKPI
jgi:hypothetical protein